MLLNNIILNSDSYKSSHFLQYPKKTKYISSYIESRGGVFKDVLFFGLQYFIKKYLLKPITKQDIDIAEKIITKSGLPFNRKSWDYILEKHNGNLPIKIEALKEGCITPTRTALVQIINTDEKCYWLTSFLETALLRAIWYPTTVASLSYSIKKRLKQSFLETSDLDINENLPFKLHDFGSRGASSTETAGIGGLAHLVNFKGTDTLSANAISCEFYNEDVAGFSIPASEHSTMTSWKREGEKDAYENMINNFGGEGKTFAIVSDSYNLWNALENIYGETLKHKIQTNGGTLVVRPDSGDPCSVVCKTIEILMNKFGFTVNSKGYKVLPNYIRVLQGDGISSKSIDTILNAVQEKGFAVDNISFGMGGELLQKIDRDSLKFAMKASSAKVNNEWRDVFKDPITDKGKRSKKGILAVIKENDEVKTIRKSDLKNNQKNLLEKVFENGKLLKDLTLEEIRNNQNL